MLGIQEVIEYLNQLEDKKVISIIGAGGKTTLMYTLAQHYAEEKKRVLVTTTTHIRRPDQQMVVDSVIELKEQWSQRKIGVVGQNVKNQKLKALDDQVLRMYMQESEMVLIEADGAKELPCKVPNDTEPVIVDETNVILMVLGLDTLGKRMRDVCFRIELAMDLLEEDRDHKMTEEDLIVIVKYQLDRLKQENVLNDGKNMILILNKCDTKKQRKQGEHILEVLREEEGCIGFLTKLV